MDKKPVARKKGLRDLLLLLLIFVLCIFGFFVFKQQLDLNQLSHEKQQLQQQIDAISKEKQAIEQEKTTLNDPAVLEKNAREQGMTKPGEVPFVDNNSKKSDN